MWKSLSSDHLEFPLVHIFLTSWHKFEGHVPCGTTLESQSRTNWLIESSSIALPLPLQDKDLKLNHSLLRPQKRDLGSNLNGVPSSQYTFASGFHYTFGGCCGGLT